MENKGLYTGAVALIAVAIIIASSFSMVSSVQSHQQESYANNIMETKWQMQNAKHLTGKIVSDALADSGFLSGCTFVINDIIATLGSGSDGYLKETLDDSFSDCTVEVEGTQDLGGNQVRVNIRSISCSREFDGISINYEKEGLEFNKQISYYTDLNTFECTIDVRDVDSGKCDVDTIEALVTENIC